MRDDRAGGAQRSTIAAAAEDRRGAVGGRSLSVRLGAVLAPPGAPASREFPRSLFGRLSPDVPEALALSLRNIGVGPTDG